MKSNTVLPVVAVPVIEVVVFKTGDVEMVGVVAVVRFLQNRQD